MWPLKKKENSKAVRKGLVFRENQFAFEDIDDKAQGTLYRWLGETWYHTFAVDKNGVLKPFKVREYLGESPVLPDKLYRGLRWKACVQPLFRLEPSWLDKVNMWLGIALVAILGLLIFLVLTSLGGS